MARLLTLNYDQWAGTAKEWKIEGLDFSLVNLLVGRNSSGKTRSLNVIRGLGGLLAGETLPNFMSGTYKVKFDDGGKILDYELEIQEKKVVREIFKIDGKEFLNRQSNGAGNIWANKLDDNLEFQLSMDQIAAVARRDSIQHPFFDPLYEWGKGLFHYKFGSPLGKDNFAIVDKQLANEPNPKDSNQVIGIFRKGDKDYGEEYRRAIIEDMGKLGYLIKDIGTMAPMSVVIQKPVDVICLYVQEEELGEVTDQGDMSQGMFRALSLLIQINYAERIQSPKCILIDDVGEGLDYERSCALIDILMEKASKTGLQVIMATNDRFVMNAVPLEAWTVLKRRGNMVKVYNYKSSKDRFDEFKLTGMNNFDFFAFDFVSEGEST